MPARPFPGDPNAEVCVVTGGPANARNDGGRIHGWYGSTVVDGKTLVAVDPTVPSGPLCDAYLREAIADGRVFDPARLQSGAIELSDVPDAAVAGLASFGAASVLRALDGPADGGARMHVPPVVEVGKDDRSTAAAAAALFGMPRHRGVDLEGLGGLAALAARARGLPAEPAAIGAALLARIREREAFDADLRRVFLEPDG